MPLSDAVPVKVTVASSEPYSNEPALLTAKELFAVDFTASAPFAANEPFTTL